MNSGSPQKHRLIIDKSNFSCLFKCHPSNHEENDFIWFGIESCWTFDSWIFAFFEFRFVYLIKQSKDMWLMLSVNIRNVFECLFEHVFGFVHYILFRKKITHSLFFACIFQCVINQIDVALGKI